MNRSAPPLVWAIGMRAWVARDGGCTDSLIGPTPLARVRMNLMTDAQNAPEGVHIQVHQFSGRVRSYRCNRGRGSSRAGRLRAILVLVDDVLRDMLREFDGVYACVGRPRSH